MDWEDLFYEFDDFTEEELGQNTIYIRGCIGFEYKKLVGKPFISGHTIFSIHESLPMELKISWN